MKDDDPSVIAWRLGALETKVDQLSAKLDALTETVGKSICPSPGSCVGLLDALKRLESVVGMHETQILDVRMKMEKAGASIRTIVIIAGGAGSVLGVIGSLLVKWVS